MARHPYVAIEGVIGVGKTSLARLMQPEIGGQVLLEEFEENPFLSNFYDDRERHAFQTQIFFLLSRYRQQTSFVPKALLSGPVVADYVFDKDRLFAQLNLSGDELAMYERVYTALGEKMRQPDLVIYLRADLDVLMRRIQARDRPYERNMDPAYIEELRLAYEDFVASYQDAPVLVIDTNNLDFVLNEDDRSRVIERIKSSLQFGVYQTQLPGVEAASLLEPGEMLHDLEARPHGLTEFQQFHLSLDAEKGFDSDLYLNFIGLNEEIGELARVLKLMWSRQSRYGMNGLSAREAFEKVLVQNRERIQDELADCLAYLLKLSNYAGIDLEQAYLQKMIINANRSWKDGQVVPEEG